MDTCHHDPIYVKEGALFIILTRYGCVSEFDWSRAIGKILSVHVGYSDNNPYKV